MILLLNEAGDDTVANATYCMSHQWAKARGGVSNDLSRTGSLESAMSDDDLAEQQRQLQFIDIAFGGDGSRFVGGVCVRVWRECVRACG